MWPWEHLAVGYILYSAWRRVSGGSSTTGRAVLVLAVATQLPDLIDKPLGWGTTWLPGGHSLAHSLFFALPVVTVAYAASRHSGTPGLGAAFGIGYLSHLPGDMVYPLVMNGELGTEFLFWPLIPADASISTSVVGRAGDLLAAFIGFLATPVGLVYLGFEIALLGTAVLLWYVDGVPGVGEAGTVVKALFAS